MKENMEKVNTGRVEIIDCAVKWEPSNNMPSEEELLEYASKRALELEEQFKINDAMELQINLGILRDLLDFDIYSVYRF